MQQERVSKKSTFKSGFKSMLTYYFLKNSPPYSQFFFVVCCKFFLQQGRVRKVYSGVPDRSAWKFDALMTICYDGPLESLGVPFIKNFIFQTVPLGFTVHKTLQGITFEFLLCSIYWCILERAGGNPWTRFQYVLNFFLHFIFSIHAFTHLPFKSSTLCNSK